MKKKNKKNNLFLNYLLLDFNNYLSQFLPSKVSKKLASEGKTIFSYFIAYGVEEVLLLVNEKKEGWQGTYRVFPSYYTKTEKLEIFEKDLSKNIRIFSIKDYYLNYLSRFSI